MQTIIYRQATVEDIPLLVQNIIYSSMRPNNHCLHSWAGDSPAELTADFRAGFEAGEMFYILACSGQAIIGAMGGEYDPELNRIWLHGPHVFTGSWSILATRLYEELLVILPATTERWEAFLNTKNTAGIDFYRKHGFTQGSVSHDYRLAKSRRVDCPKDKCVKLSAEYHASFTALFNRLFPETYYTADALIQMHNLSHHISILPDAGTIAGFSVAFLETSGSKGEVQFIGVAEEKRGQGYGRQLLASAVDWLFDERNAEDIILNVEENLVNAKGLYESVGFTLSFSGLPLTRKKVRPLEL
ncbi:MAG: GNAT family N-acetyltransferase [Spirochaetes bacterium]|nr:GNAT family N-acetyltransferase [Spirochaetota bacterium]MBU0954870.1 GNAT family N-acetyltransferase [Spirochaetota bacterium]